jgi:hypothetical protein
VAAMTLWVGGQQAIALKCEARQGGSGSCGPLVNQRKLVELRLSRYSVHPGGTFKSRIKNDSTEDFGYGRARSLQRYEDGRWIRLPEKQVLDIGLVVRAESVSPWQGIHIPAEARPGRYRVRQMVRSIDQQPTSQFPVYAYFRVCKGCIS